MLPFSNLDMRLKWNFMTCVWIAFIVLLNLFGVAGQTASVGPSFLYADTEQGLNQFSHDLLDAYKANNGQSMTALLLSLKVDDKWFNDNFSADEARQLSDRYAEAFAGFRSRTEKRFAKFAPSEQLSIKTTQVKEQPESVTVTYWATPKNLVKLESYRFLYSAPQQGSSEWVDTFVYDTGGFRYIGPGAFPFWAKVTLRFKKSESH